ncbi:MAG TPA: isoprenyl transferase [Pyrinomonadaceae bacterium]|nr:isoprenyl transferase [Pyrinomonadaceae bacterium]
MSNHILKEFESVIESGSKEEFLLRQVAPERLPAHVAIIMDGNGRWAARRNQPRVAGHRAGAEAVRASVDTSARLGIGYLTLYAFSTENWKRPRLEVEALMGLLREFLRKEVRILKDNNIRFQTIGREQSLESAVRREIDHARRETESNTGMVLTVALSYSGRSEITHACRELVREFTASGRSPAEITEHDIERHLFTTGIPDPDLLIRTSGELRVSNFLLWQIAYSEIYVTETLWPDFRRANLFEAIIEFQKRERRYGDVKSASKSPLLAANMK